MNISRLQVKEDIYDIKDNAARSSITGINSTISTINGKITTVEDDIESLEINVTNITNRVTGAETNIDNLEVSVGAVLGDFNTLGTYIVETETLIIKE